MCMGDKACKACSRVNKKHSSIKGISMKKLNFKVIKPALAGMAGFAAAKLINKIPKVGDNALISGGAKIAAAVIAPGLVGNKVPFVNEIAVGVAIAGITDIVRQYMPSVASFIAAPTVPGGNPLSMRRPLRSQVAGIEETVKYS